MMVTISSKERAQTRWSCSTAKFDALGSRNVLPNPTNPYLHSSKRIVEAHPQDPVSTIDQPPASKGQASTAPANQLTDREAVRASVVGAVDGAC